MVCPALGTRVGGVGGGNLNSEGVRRVELRCLNIEISIFVIGLTARWRAVDAALLPAFRHLDSHPSVRVRNGLVYYTRPRA